VAAGEGAGLYLPTDAPWVAHSDLATLVGGIRALLMQALHPGSLAGVCSHSRYKNDRSADFLERSVGLPSLPMDRTKPSRARHAGSTECMNESKANTKTRTVKPQATALRIQIYCSGFTLRSWIPFSAVTKCFRGVPCPAGQMLTSGYGRNLSNPSV
jgi:hypothetical protein